MRRTTDPAPPPAARDDVVSVYYPLRESACTGTLPMSSERLRVTSADITTLRVDFVCFEPRVRAAFERALEMHADGESA